VTDDLAGAAGAVDRLPAHGQLPKGWRSLPSAAAQGYAEGGGGAIEYCGRRRDARDGPARQSQRASRTRAGSTSHSMRKGLTTMLDTVSLVAAGAVLNGGVGGLAFLSPSLPAIDGSSS
jgi:hypothetical protein